MLTLMKHLGTTVAAVDYGAEQFVDHAYSLSNIAGEFVAILILILNQSPIGV